VWMRMAAERARGQKSITKGGKASSSASSPSSVFSMTSPDPQEFFLLPSAVPERYSVTVH
jgi:hypothetical protein